MVAVMQQNIKVEVHNTQVEVQNIEVEVQNITEEVPNTWVGSLGLHQGKHIYS